MTGRLIAIVAFGCATVAVRAEDITATVEPEKPAILLGEPIFLKFTLHNQTDHDIYFEEGGDYRNRLGRPEKYAVTARDEKNDTLPIIDVGPTMGGLEVLDRIPAHGTWQRELFLPSWVRFTSVGRYRIECSNDLKTARCARELEK